MRNLIDVRMGAKTHGLARLAGMLALPLVAFAAARGAFADGLPAGYTRLIVR